MPSFSKPESAPTPIPKWIEMWLFIAIAVKEEISHQLWRLLNLRGLSQALHRTIPYVLIAFRVHTLHSWPPDRYPRFYGHIPPQNGCNIPETGVQTDLVNISHVFCIRDYVLQSQLKDRSNNATTTHAQLGQDTAGGLGKDRRKIPKDSLDSQGKPVNFTKFVPNFEKLCPFYEKSWEKAKYVVYCQKLKPRFTDESTISQFSIFQSVLNFQLIQNRWVSRTNVGIFANDESLLERSLLYKP